MQLTVFAKARAFVFACVVTNGHGFVHWRRIASK